MGIVGKGGLDIEAILEVGKVVVVGERNGEEAL